MATTQGSLASPAGYDRHCLRVPVEQRGPASPAGYDRHAALTGWPSTRGQFPVIVSHALRLPGRIGTDAVVSPGTVARET